MKKITFAIAAVIVSGLVASQATAGTCTKTVGLVTYKKYCPGPIAGWTYSPGAKFKKVRIEKLNVEWVPWDEVLNDEPEVRSIRIATINTSNYILKDITTQDGKRFYSIYNNDSPVVKKITSEQFKVESLRDKKLKNYLKKESFSSFDLVTTSETTKNHPFKPVLPVAKAGNGQSVHLGATVTLDGKGSIKDPYYCANPKGKLAPKGKPEPCPLVYRWSFVSRPPNSEATLSGAALEKPTFVADVAGEYVLELVVSSGEVKSPVDRVIIRADK